MVILFILYLVAGFCINFIFITKYMINPNTVEQYGEFLNEVDFIDFWSTMGLSVLTAIVWPGFLGIGLIYMVFNYIGDRFKVSIVSIYQKLAKKIRSW